MAFWLDAQAILAMEVPPDIPGIGGALAPDAPPDAGLALPKAAGSILDVAPALPDIRVPGQHTALFERRSGHMEPKLKGGKT